MMRALKAEFRPSEAWSRDMQRRNKVEVGQIGENPTVQQLQGGEIIYTFDQPVNPNRSNDVRIFRLDLKRVKSTRC
jgi:hypothetical protein